MASKLDGILYIGYTNDLDSRVLEHKHKVNPKSFSARYNCDKLVYFEELEDESLAST
tara:strand:- start:325 stop:495 length:171 start_codon:yes stop_codon:yes gene_type:complete